jgi:redox-sensitive bicupin YhaK (pirin superfamily)
MKISRRTSDGCHVELGTGVQINALENCDLLFLSAQPLNEPINGQGPFVMNSYDEILQAYDDIKTGKFELF